MRLTVVGCSGSFPGVGSPASCYLLQAPDDVTGETVSVVVDLGSGALGALQQYVRPDGIDAVLLSHMHPDHFMDLCGLYVTRRYRPGGATPSGAFWIMSTYLIAEGLIATGLVAQVETPLTTPG